MKKLHLLGLLAMSLSLPAFAQSAGESIKDTANDAKRGVKKGANRVEETFCTGTKAECAAKKAKNRSEEASDAVKDKATEVKDKLDADNK
ncbi:MAG: hypothetical protein DI536_22590 [Archangium gephyra]|uniref:Late embryogenesis abundant protein n=1 Tax=Archangium gephyra TaxID=48 RepID=A0A2W5VGD6_9BACT|nr:MAG: hypothetical protein DI536_22590 [Archangium gephyra]